ncbi:MAG: hypothetical protein ACLPN5_22635 [Roseiarcus sp.]
MKRHLLVFEEGNGEEIDLRAFVDSLDAGAQLYAFDGRVCFLKSRLTAHEISDRFLKFSGSSLFFISDISASDCSGRMFGIFWDFMKKSALPQAAE